MSSLEERLKTVLDKLKKDVKESMVSDVGKLVVNKEKEHIITDVYDVYTPKKYNRREDNGGLSDIDNIIISTHGECGIVVENTTKPNTEYESKLFESDSLSDLIEFGNGYNGLEYNFNNGEEYLNPRPFQQNTLEELQESGEHIEVLKKSLKNKGYKIK